MNAAPTPILAVTMGDAAGIGPELCLRLLAKTNQEETGYSVVVLGSARLLERVSASSGIPLSGRVFSRAEDLTHMEGEAAAILDLGLLESPDSVQPGAAQAACGRAAMEFVRHAVSGVLEGAFDAIVTAPLNKEALHLGGGSRFSGHTEMLAEFCGHPGDEAMLLYSDKIAVSFATLHVSLLQACQSLNQGAIVKAGILTSAALERLRGSPPLLGVLGLNPHAGEHGLFGSEEELLIAPAIDELRRHQVRVEGPLVPDTAFSTPNLSRYDGFLAMYHDQGSIPFKTLAFDEGVNVTMGLPIVRTSPDHGTAFDLAWKGTASPNSFIAAVRLAARLAAARRGVE